MAFRSPSTPSARRNARPVACTKLWVTRGALGRLVMMGALVGLGTPLECCSEGGSFWSDLDDPARTPSGAGSHSASQLPRLCPAQAMQGGVGVAFSRCAGGATSTLHLLEHVNAGRSWRRLLDIAPHRLVGTHYQNHLPAWRTLQLLPADLIRIFYCSPPGYTAASKSTLYRTECAHDVDSFHELPRDWAAEMRDYPRAPPGRALHPPLEPVDPAPLARHMRARAVPQTR